MKEPTGAVTLNTLISTYANTIFALAAGISGDQEDAEDIMQNVFFKIGRHINKVKRMDTISPWILNTTYREALQFLKTKYRNIKTFEGETNAAGRHTDWLFINRSKLPDEALLGDELDEQANSAIQEIPLLYRMPLLLHQVHGLSLAQSSEILGVNVATVKVRLARAYRLLRKTIARYLDGREPQKEKAQPHLACNIWTGFIDDYAAGDLDKKQKISFEKHIQGCAGCKTFLDSYKKAIRLTQALECRDVAPALQKKIETFLIKLKKGAQGSKGGRRR